MGVWAEVGVSQPCSKKAASCRWIGRDVHAPRRRNVLPGLSPHPQMHELGFGDSDEWKSERKGKVDHAQIQH